jgi:hypothetical protein
LTDWGRVWDGILPLSRQTNPSRRGGISGVSQSETSLHFSQIERGPTAFAINGLMDKFQQNLILLLYLVWVGEWTRSHGNKHIPTFAHKQDSWLATRKREDHKTHFDKIDFGCAPTHGKLGRATANLSCYFLAATTTFSRRKLRRNGALPPLNHLSVKFVPLKLKIVSTNPEPTCQANVGPRLQLFYPRISHTTHTP